MAAPQHERKQKSPVGPCVVSLISVLFTQLALYSVPHFFSPSSSLLTLLSLSAVALLLVTVLGVCCKKLIGVRVSPPAFVFITIFFIWSVYILVLRQAITTLVDIIFNIELFMIVIGLCSIMLGDPGVVASGSSCLDELVTSPFSDAEAHSESSVSLKRVRYCKHCKTCVKGYDHHCPAFGNCIGQKNHVLFIALLVGFVISEASYIACSSQFAKESHIMDKTWSEASLSTNLVISTMIFSLLQVLWQVVFLTWHIYCICFNVTTDEWINWKRYPEFQLIVQPQPGQQLAETRFANPYDKGILRNLKEFLNAKR